MEVGVVANRVLPERGEDVASPALFEHAGLFADDFERGADVARTQQLAQAQHRVVIGGQKVVLGIEPEDDGSLGLGGGRRGPGPVARLSERQAKNGEEQG